MSLVTTADIAAMVKLLATASDPRIDAPLIERKRQLLESVRTLVGADAWIWTAGRVASGSADDTVAINLLDGGWRGPDERTKVLRLLGQPTLRSIVAEFIRNAVEQQSVLTRCRQEILDDEHFNASLHGQALHNAGFEQFVASVCTVQPRVYSVVAYGRRNGKDPFSRRDREILHLVFQQTGWVHHTALTAPDFESFAALSRREREVLILLLEGYSRKEVASRLNLSAHTIADYQKIIYKKLDVSSRAGLLARFIHGPGVDSL